MFLNISSVFYGIPIGMFLMIILAIHLLIISPVSEGSGDVMVLRRSRQPSAARHPPPAARRPPPAMVLTR